MKRAINLAILSLVAALAISPALAGGNANFTIGQRSMSDDAWEDVEVEDQPAFGVTVDFGPDSWPIRLAAGYYISAKEEELYDAFIGDADATGVVAELTFGVRKTWEVAGNTRIFVGGGAAAVITGLEVDGSNGSFDDSDTGTGFYAQGGAYWRIGSRFNIGLDLRGLFGTDVELEDLFNATSISIEGDSDYFQAGILLGWGWPAE